jgi:hypothetical protein
MMENNGGDDLAVSRNYFFFLGGAAVTPCASPPLRPSIFSDYSFVSATLLTWMTGISLHMPWPLNSQSRGSRNYFFNIYFFGRAF